MLLGVVLDIESLEHPGEYGEALATTGGIELTIKAHLGLGRLAHPELCHAEGREALLVGILQELGGTAVAGTAGGIGEALAYLHAVVVVPHLNEVALLTIGVEHAVLTEEPLLEVFRELLTALAQLDDEQIVGTEGVDDDGHGGNDALGLLEMAVGLLGVIDGRHKPRPVVAACQQTAIG